MSNKTSDLEKVHNKSSVIITPDELLSHWQGHRSLTRRVIEAFPEDKLFNYSIGGMRPFFEMAMEMIGMAAPCARGLATGEWIMLSEMVDDVVPATPKTKEELLQLWDWNTEQINSYWAQIPDDHFQDTDVAYGQYEGKIWWMLFFFMDNEVHHRGQGYVYLRSLGIEPPHFMERD